MMIGMPSHVAFPTLHFARRSSVSSRDTAIRRQEAEVAVPMEDCCAVCAEPLQWVAYGKCGHKEACSKCVARLRFVLEDKRCVICQQPLPVVFATKFLGAYTKAIAGLEFEELQVRASQTMEARLGLHNLPTC